MATPTVLVAEDDCAIRELLTHHLQREGLAVVGLSNGHAALRHARGAADLLVLDVGLPGVDGYDVVRTLRREERTLPIVLLTARTEEIDRVLGFELGADDFIAKPFSRARGRRAHQVDIAPQRTRRSSQRLRFCDSDAWRSTHARERLASTAST